MESTDSHAGMRPPVQTETIDETVPLLGDENADLSAMNASIKRRTFLIMSIIIVIIDLAMWLGIAPQAQILEDIICRQYYEHGPSDPMRMLLPITNYDCKVPYVQSELAFISGWYDTVSSLPTIFLTVPYGALSDRTSRRYIIFLACVGLIFADGLTKIIVAFPNIFPLRLIWATPIFLIIGGGGGVVSSLLYAILADVFPPAERANAFFFLNGLGLVASTAAGPLSAALMLRNPWIPYLMSTPGLIIITGLLALLPHIERRKQEEIVEDPSMIKASDIKGRIMEAAQATSTFVRKNVVIMILICPYILSTFHQHPFLLIFISKRFNTSFANATFLMTIRGAVSIVVILFLIPLINRLLMTKTSMSPLTRDLRITQFSAVLLAIGMFGVGLAPSIPFLASALVVVALASPAFVGLRCVLTHLVPANNVGTLYTAMGVVVNIGIMITGPFFAATFNAGMATGITGLPFIIVGSFISLFAMAVFVTPLPKDQIALLEAEDDEEAQA